MSSLVQTQLTHNLEDFTVLADFQPFYLMQKLDEEFTFLTKTRNEPQSYGSVRFCSHLLFEHSQELWRGEEGASAQVHGVFEHEEKVEVADQIACQLIHKSAQKQREED